MSRPLHERFWAKVDRRGPAECWPWTGCRAKYGGYGKITVGGATRYAHHIVLELVGLLSEKPSRKRHVRHSCDNPPCCNPAHLILGTAKENMEGREERGRRIAPRGEGHPCAKLTDIQVKEIKAALAAGETQASLAAHFLVSPTAIWKIATGKKWKHIG